MTVYTPSLPNSNTQDDSTYKNAIDNTAQIHDRLSAAFYPHAQTTPNMTVRLEAGFIFNGLTLTEVAAQSTGTITAPVTNPRIDRVVVDASTGSVSVITGSEGASPSAPTITTGKIPVAQILLQTASTTITNTMITDERVIFSSNFTGITNSGAIVNDGNGEVTWAAQVDDYALGADISRLRITLTGDQTLTGIANGVEGREITLIVNDATDVLTIAFNSTSSAVGNRFIAPDSRDYVVPPYSVVTLTYSVNTWRIKSAAALPPATTAEMEAGTVTDPRSMTPANVASAIAALGGSIGTNFLHIQDQKASGTDGGTFTSGSPQVRTLNTVVTNTISGASLASNLITLPSGTYFIIASAPTFGQVARNRASLYNSTDASYELLGTTQYANLTSIRSVIHGQFTIAASKDFYIYHECSSTVATDGFGRATSFGETEIYTDVMIWKV